MWQRIWNSREGRGPTFAADSPFCVVLVSDCLVDGASINASVPSQVSINEKIVGADCVAMCAAVRCTAWVVGGLEMWRRF